ncbi:sugar transferase [Agarivorans sp. Z349TD_8]|uniref:sugar transferase n=1 Tax=Agarivorans sp. Z349TD_8 TaxID=3421434 RepID=UPI003D7D0D2B
MNDECAPVVIFVFNRPLHTQKVLKALSQCILAESTELYIYADGPRTNEDSKLVQLTRECIRKVNGFKKVNIIESSTNRGLAESIISGVTEIVLKQGKIIVLEDDIVVAQNFLLYMNQSLNYYRDNNRVWQVSSYSFAPLAKMAESKCLLPLTNCWGWATWADRWAHFERNPTKLIKSYDKQQRYEFDLQGRFNFWEQVKANYAGRTKTWAVFWYATVYEKGGLTVYPREVYSENIGLDGSGVHCEDLNFIPRELSKLPVDSFYPKVVDYNVYDEVCAHLAKDVLGLYERMYRKINRLFKRYLSL